MVYREILQSFVFVQDYVTEIESVHLRVRFLTPFQRILPSNPRESFPVISSRKIRKDRIISSRNGITPKI